MRPKPTNPQNEFLNTAREERKRVEVYLVNGVKLTGSIASFGQFVLMLSGSGGMQTIYKSAISTIQVQAGVRQTGSRLANDIESTRPTVVESKRRPRTAGGEGK